MQEIDAVGLHLIKFWTLSWLMAVGTREITAKCVGWFESLAREGRERDQGIDQNWNVWKAARGRTLRDMSSGKELDIFVCFEWSSYKVLHDSLDGSDVHNGMIPQDTFARSISKLLMTFSLFTIALATRATVYRALLIWLHRFNMTLFTIAALSIGFDFWPASNTHFFITQSYRPWGRINLRRQRQMILWKRSWLPI